MSFRISTKGFPRAGVAHVAAALEIGPGAEGAPGAGEDDGAHRGIFDGVSEMGAQLADEIRREGVAVLRRVEGDPRRLSLDGVARAFRARHGFGLHHDQHGVGVDHLAHLDPHLGHHAGGVGDQLVLHLHGLEHRAARCPPRPGRRRRPCTSRITPVIGATQPPASSSPRPAGSAAPAPARRSPSGPCTKTRVRRHALFRSAAARRRARGRCPSASRAGDPRVRISRRRSRGRSGRPRRAT